MRLAHCIVNFAGAALGLVFSLVSVANEIAIVQQKPESSPIIEELFLMETVYPQGEGELQLTLTTYRVKNNGSVLETVGFEYGITDQWQVEANVDIWLDRDLQHDRRGSQSGIGDIEIGVKYTLPSTEPEPVLFAIGLEIVVPSGDVDKSLGGGYWVYEPYFVVGKAIDEQTHVIVNAAYGLRSLYDRAEFNDGKENRAKRDELELSLGYVHSFKPEWRGTIELVWETDRLDGGSKRGTDVVLGVKYKGIDEFELGIGLELDLKNDNNNPGLFFTLSYES